MRTHSHLSSAGVRRDTLWPVMDTVVKASNSNLPKTVVYANGHTALGGDIIPHQCKGRGFRDI